MYNIEIDNIEDKTLVFNTVSGALGLMNCETRGIYENLETIDMDEIDSSKKEIVKTMKENGYIVDSDIDEYKKLSLEEKLIRYSKKGALHLTIAPTMNCNMECPYCYEFKEVKRMSKETQDATINYIKNYLNENKEINVMTLAWYGGEPLLEKETIRYVSKEIIEFCSKNGIAYASNIITNGALLDYETAKMLREECLVSYAQVTLDGVYGSHNNTRILKTGGDSFRIVTDNIDAVKDVIQVVVRMNVNKDNKESCNELIKFFKDKNWEGKVKLYFAPVTAKEDTNKCVSDSCFTCDEFNEIYPALEKQLVDSEISENITYPNNFFGCSAVGVHGKVIDPEGNFSKCWHRINLPEHWIGNVRQGLKINKEYVDWLTIDTPEKCTSCNILPVCRSGCPHIRLKNNNEGICEYSLEEIKKMIKNYYSKMVG